MGAVSTHASSHREPAEGTSRTLAPRTPSDPPSLFDRAYALAESAHESQLRATDGRPFLDHVVEVATLLENEGYDQELVVTGLLHDAVERGTMTAAELRSEVGPEICALVMALTEDAGIESFDARKTALREQVEAAGERAVTVFAADKLSDIVGLGRGVEADGVAVESRMGTSVASMAGHYRGSVEMIASRAPASPFLPALRAELDRLDSIAR